MLKKKGVITDGLWIRCDACKGLVYKKAMEERLDVCPECNHHFRISARRRIEITLDKGSFEELWADMHPADPIEFKDRISYSERTAQEQKKTGLNEAAVVGLGSIEGKKIVFGVTDSNFIMGSMGSVMGEKIARAAEKAAETGLPLIIVSGSGGGARMQEGMFSLMQMAKTNATISRLHDAGGTFVSILTDPTMGGVMASYASQGDIIIAEPGALIGFAGPRVIQQTIKKTLPPDFQSAEFLLEHGFLDMIVSRQDMKKELSRIIDYLNGPAVENATEETVN
ncbi:MAG TPA: acetyl-CoA carboxylase, carboxyltransferase subunit beta [Candidatus Avalokitesvara rifleensis]|uniref:acetyl-CoA carboxylase, carboxyltransferase subunit beta n=1 Tax=Candidatus Avalokitesvara rifleensis TaxID=3367620 RepID=UPI002712D3F5|nr:acetyl-CoA carboxylase, carboxyltransferase subunit beta [Candidatus Brocadiales bacterium]